MKHALASLLALSLLAAVPPGDPNLAKDRPARASSEETGKGNLAGRAVDGNPATRWCAANASLPQTLEVDLGAEQALHGLRIRWENPDGTYRYTVEGSTDGQAWKRIVDASRADGVNGVAEHVVDVPAVRRLRLTCTGTAGGWASVWEFEAYADKIPNAGKALGSPAGGDELLRGVRAPGSFDVTLFAHPPEVNYPVCLAAAPTGELFVGVDENGSLGKIEGYGKVLRCVDRDGDGKADEVKVFAKMLHPRGLVWDDGTLWVLHPPFLTRYRDTDGDGVSDEEKDLLKGISTEQTVTQRGADHTTNGIRMGIDGWIYIAVGDFGYLKAVDAEGKEHQLLGGGIARVRPDGTELEVYAKGTRNICDVAIDPFMNVYTRDNTNDGGGWDIRVSYIPQGAHMGYPSLFKSFSDEILEPLAVYGGGSGTGALYVDEPSLPEAYRHALLTADWGRSMVYFHNIQPKGAGYTPAQEDFLRLERVTGLDVDGSGRLYAASWKGGEFSYKGPNIGFVVRLSAKGATAAPFPDLKKASDADLLVHLASDSHVLRFRAQREILRRGPAGAFAEGLEALASGGAGRAAKAAAIFTLKQLLGAKAAPALLRLAAKAEVREFALRALADRMRERDGVPTAPFLSGLADADPRVRAAAATALGRLGRAEAGPALVKAAADADPVVAHLAMRALEALGAAKACLDALGPTLTPEARGALRALHGIHSAEAVDGLLAKLGSTTDASLRKELLTALVRLYHKEGVWPGDWWGTRPDTSGPYYRRAKWEETPKIEAALLKEAKGPEAAHVLAQLQRHKVLLPGVSLDAAAGAGAAPTVNLSRILEAQSKGKKNGVGGMPFEAATAAILKETGDPAAGAKLFQRQGCSVCHTISPDEPPRGPMLLDIGKRYPKDVLLQSILKPSAVIAQGFNSVIFGLTNGDRVIGFVTAEGAEDLTIRTAAGEQMTLIKSKIEARRNADLSMMPEGIVAALSPKEVASLLEYLETLKSKP